MVIDVVVPVAPKDLGKLPLCLRGLVAHCRTPIRRIHVISAEPVTIALDGVEVRHVPESRFAFCKQDIARALDELGCAHASAGWYYQQLLKLHVFRALPELLPDTLILDSDFVLLDDLSFVDDDGRAWLAFGYPFAWLLDTREYPREVEHVHAEFAARLVPGWAPQHAFSGMQHHMLVQADILEQLLALIEQTHGRPAWRAFMAALTVDKWNAASEYVLYHHFALARHPQRVRTRHLRACDIIHDADASRVGLAHFEYLLPRARVQALGCHAFSSLRARIETMDYIPPPLRARMLAANAPAYELHLDDGMLRMQW